MVSAIIALVLGILVIASVFLPWIIVERTEPLVAIRGGLIDIGRHHSLIGISPLIGINNIVGDVLLFALPGALISTVYIPLITLIEEKRAFTVRTLLFLLSGLCIATSIALIYMHRTWWICLRIDGSLGFSATFKDPGIGLLTASSSPICLMALGVK